MVDDKTKWYDRQLAAGIIAGLIVAGVVWLVPLIYTEATKAKVPGWVYIVVVAGGVLVASLILPLWRRKVWAWVPRSVGWVRGLRPTTARARAALVASGVASRQEALDEERRHTPQPAWRVQLGDTHFVAPDVNWLYNWGHEAIDASLTCDPAYFELDGEAFFRGKWKPGGSGGTGKQFRGMATAKGLAEGIEFTVSWRDINGDAHSRPVRVPPEDVRKATEAIVEHARETGYQEGLRDGRKQGKPTATVAATPSPEPSKSPTDPPISKERRLEIIAHKEKQIATERAVLDRMMGRATDDATINRYLDSVADLDARSTILKGERIAVEMGDKKIPKPRKS